MTGLLLPDTKQTELTGAILLLRKMDTPCRADPDRTRWYTERTGIAKTLDEAYARGVCHSCTYRAMCAAWAFEMEQYWLWAGFTAVERRWLRDKRPDLVEEVVALVREYLQPGERFGFAERAEAVMAKLDLALPQNSVEHARDDEHDPDVDDEVAIEHNVSQ